MKPINAFEIRRSYQIFILNFVLLSLFSVFCIFLFFAASDQEYLLLDKKVKETEKLSSLRKEINTNFDLILLRFRELSKYRSYNSEELSKQAVLLDDIQTANYKLKDLISQRPEKTKSFEFYEKLNNNVGALANLQDSLFSSRYKMESNRDQLNECLRVTRDAAKKIRGGRFSR